MSALGAWAKETKVSHRLGTSVSNKDLAPQRRVGRQARPPPRVDASHALASRGSPAPRARRSRRPCRPHVGQAPSPGSPRRIGGAEARRARLGHGTVGACQGRTTKRTRATTTGRKRHRQPGLTPGTRSTESPSNGWSNSCALATAGKSSDDEFRSVASPTIPAWARASPSCAASPGRGNRSRNCFCALGARVALTRRQPRSRVPISLPWPSQPTRSSASRTPGVAFSGTRSCSPAVTRHEDSSWTWTLARGPG
jgi:hypothetical protein